MNHGWLKALGRRRLPEDDLVRHDAFLDDIDRRWDEDRHGVWLAVRSTVVHVYTRLFTGGPTFAGVGVAATITALGSGILTAAPPLHDRAWGGQMPLWINVCLTLGVFGLAFETARSPRCVHPRRFAAAAAVPLSAGALLAAVTLNSRVLPDMLVRVGLAVAAVGLAAAGVAAARAAPSLFRVGVLICAVAAAIVAVSNAAWVPMAVVDQDHVWAIGTGCSAVGAALLAAALIRARPPITTTA